MSTVIDHPAGQAPEDHPDREDHPAPLRRTGTHGRNPLTWLVAAAAVVLIAGVGAFGLVNRGADEAPLADGGTAVAPSDTSADPSSDPAGGADVIAAGVTELTAPAVTGRCIAPTAEVIRNQSLAFQGTVTAITDGVVTLSTSDVFSGKVASEVRVTAPATDLRELVGAVKFKVGSYYLVSATDGRVSVCGFSGPVSPQLQQLYGEAFAG